MSFGGNNDNVFSFPASVDLSTSQFLAVKITTGGKLAVAAVGDLAVGVLQNKPGANQPGVVVFSGVTKMVAGAAITVGALIASDASGKAKVATTGATTSSNVLGIALSAAAAGDVFPVLFNPAGGVPTTNA